jgi:hypothetical protein
MVTSLKDKGERLCKILNTKHNAVCDRLGQLLEEKRDGSPAGQGPHAWRVRFHQVTHYKDQR